MNKADQKFIEEYKPLSIPSDYHTDASEQDKVIYCLADIELGTAHAVAHKIHEYEPTEPLEIIQEYTSRILSDLYEKGLLKGDEQEGVKVYDLSKITSLNKGQVNPDLIQ
ncbi:MAG: hypothetical protein JWN56_1737 [Sphingobacteriales bacterium]|nr:hypothetical protein [Sphingobacteriales bacterium]